MFDANVNRQPGSPAEFCDPARLRKAKNRFLNFRISVS